jgi:hypothetical protein
MNFILPRLHHDSIDQIRIRRLWRPTSKNFTYTQIVIVSKDVFPKNMYPALLSTIKKSGRKFVGCSEGTLVPKNEGSRGKISYYLILTNLAGLWSSFCYSEGLRMFVPRHDISSPCLELTPIA